jgi:hypothetical protein
MTQQYQGAALESKLSVETWAEDFADVLTTFNSDQLNRSLFGLFATRKKASEAVTYADLCVGFLHLIDTHVLVPEFRSAIADEQLADMRARFAPETIPSAAPSTSTPADPNDFSQMTKSAFEEVETRDARAWYQRNASFRARADYFWGGGL